MIITVGACVFARVDYKIIENRRSDDNDKHEFNGEQDCLRRQRNGYCRRDPRTDNPARNPAQFLGEASRLDPNRDPLTELAAWLT